MLPPPEFHTVANTPAIERLVLKTVLMADKTRSVSLTILSALRRGLPLRVKACFEQSESESNDSL